MTISPISTFLTNPTLVNMAQNTKAAVSVETSLKAVGRPTFTLMDKNVDKDKRKFSATKELLYQLLCLGLYLSLIPFFKEGGFKLIKNILKDEKHLGIKMFENTKQYHEYQKLLDFDKEKRLKELTKEKDFKNLLKNKKLTEYVKNTPELKSFNHVKGAIELSSIAGSVLGLTVIAPEISHIIIHPIMDFLGLKPKK